METNRNSVTIFLFAIVVLLPIIALFAGVELKSFLIIASAVLVTIVLFACMIAAAILIIGLIVVVLLDTIR